MEAWRQALGADPLPWLLETEDPAVRHLALRDLCSEGEDSPQVRRARKAAMHGPDRRDPRSPEPGWVLGEARCRLRAEVHGHGVVSDVPGAARCRRVGSSGSGSLRIRARACPDVLRWVRRVGVAV